MFSHVMIGANDLEASRKFYDAVLGTLNLSPGVANNDNRYFYRSPKGVELHPNLTQDLHPILTHPI